MNEVIGELAQVWHWPPAAYDHMPLAELMGYFRQAHDQAERQRRANAR